MRDASSLVNLAVLLGCLIVIGGVLAAIIVYLVQTQLTLDRCSPGNRKMQGGLVWLTLIPFFGCYWQFRVNSALAQSSKEEFRSGTIPFERTYPKGPGIAKAVLDVLAVLTVAGMLAALLAPSDPVTLDPYNPAWDVVGETCMLAYGVFQIAAVVLWIVAWVKMNRLRKSLPARISSSDFTPSPIPIAPAASQGWPSRYCSNCGATLGPGSFCPWCGRSRQA